MPPVVQSARDGALGNLAGVKVGVVTELGGEGYQPGVQQRFDQAVELLVAAGAEVVQVTCPNFEHALAAYYLIMPSEASSNLARFDAMRYGLRVMPEGVESPSAEEVMRATRDAGFGDEVKRRIIIGTYALSSGYYDAYYGQAQKVRTLIDRDFERAFEKADVLLSPTAPTTAFRLGEKLDDPLAMYLNDIATIPANLAGLPGISVPVGLAEEDGLPVGLQILAPALADDRLYRVGAAARGAAGTTVGRTDARPRQAGQGGRPMSTHTHRAALLRGRPRGVRPRHGARGPRRAEHRHEDVLRLPGELRRRAEHADLPDLPRPARARCRSSTAPRWSRRSASGWR